MASLDGQDADRRVRQLEAIARVASNFTFEHPLDAMMREVAHQVVEGTGTALACMVGLSDQTTQMVVRVAASYGTPEGFDEVLERTWRTAGTPLVSSSLRTHDVQFVSFARVLDRPGYEEVRELQRRAGWASMAVVPMVFRGEAVGLLIVSYPAGHEPGASEMSFLRSIADSAAVAVENSRLFEKAQESAVVEERQRLSRELHDSVSQALYAIGLGAQTARRLVETDPARAIEPLEYVIALARTGLDEMRAMIFDLRPETLAAEGLVGALRRQSATLLGRHNIEAELELGEEPAIPIDAKEALYRIAQEAIQNAVKHAQATVVAVTLAPIAGGIALTIRDNGRGFTIADDYPGHLGLVSMRERARRVGCNVTIASAPGNGCTVRVSLVMVDMEAHSRPPS